MSAHPDAPVDTRFVIAKLRERLSNEVINAVVNEAALQARVDDLTEQIGHVKELVKEADQAKLDAWLKAQE